MYSGVWAILIIGVASGMPDFRIGRYDKICGEEKCEQYQYCNDMPVKCSNCSNICHDTHNKEPKKCETECQDYIDDFIKMYANKLDISSLRTDFKNELNDVNLKLNKVYSLARISLIVSLILFLIVLAFVMKFSYIKYQERKIRNLEKKKYQQKLTSVQYTVNKSDTCQSGGTIKTISQSVTSTPIPDPDLLEETTTSATTTARTATEISTINTTTTTLPLSPHEPCEDSTLDYAAYVNQALTHSPTLEKNNLNKY